MIIAVTGYIASGKDTLAKKLIQQGYKHLSLSDILREQLQPPITREALAQLGNDMREQHGDSVLAQEAIKRIDDTDWVISSIGRVAEAKYLKEHAQATIIFVTANQDVRYQRLTQRNDTEDILSYEDFLIQEQREATGANKNFREFDNLKEYADIIIENNGTLEEFHKRIDTVLKELISSQ